MFDFFRRKKQPPEHEQPGYPPAPFELYYSSDIDGSPHLIVDASKADLADWKVELVREWDGKQTLEPFELNTAGLSQNGELSLNPYTPVVDMVPAWLLCVESQDVVAFVGPDGTRYR